MSEKPTYEELEQRIRELEQAEYERKLTEKALRESEERYRSFVQNFQGIAFRAKMNFTPIFFHGAVEEITGYTEDEFVAGKPRWDQIIHPDDLSTIIFTEHEKKLHSVPSFSYERDYRIVRNDGRIRWVHEIIQNICDNTGWPVMLQGAIYDISNRKRAEEALRESKERYRALFDRSRDLVCIHDFEGSFLDANAEVLKLFGYDREAVSHLNFATLLSEDQLPAAQAMLEELKETGTQKQAMEFRIRRKDGELIYMESIAAVIYRHGKPYAVQAIARDITESKRMKDALAAKAALESLISEASKRLLTLSELDEEINACLADMGCFCKAGRTYLFQFTPDGATMKNTHEWCAPGVKSEIENLQELPPDIFPWWMELLVTGEIIQVENVAELPPGARTEKEFLEAQNIKSVLVVPFLVGNKLAGFMGFDDVSSARIWGEKELVLLRRLADTLGLAIERKRTAEEREKLQMQLAQAQKMESIGTLAGGIAHNFNNILMGVQGRTSLMIMDKDTSDHDYEHLKGIEEYVKNAVELTRDLLGFARGGKYEVKPTDLNTLIKHENRIFGSTKKEIRVHGKYEKDLWTVEVDQSQIQQALLNLYVNASQAMPGGGDLYVQTENVSLDEEYIKPFEVAPGKYVKVSVTDIGVGMDAATREKIFDPFFSTKDVGQGSGLGLASVYGIIKNHGGFINVYSEKGAGTTFNIYLSASEKETMEEASRRDRHEIQYGQGTILLVDDEKIIVKVGQEIIKRLGYRVITAGSGKEALDLYEKQKDEIDLVILDMIMPDLGGGETYDRLKEIDGDVKVLLSSGYSITGQAKKILDRGCIGFIQKPFSMDELSRKMHEALDKDKG